MITLRQNVATNRAFHITPEVSSLRRGMFIVHDDVEP